MKERLRIVVAVDRLDGRLDLIDATGTALGVYQKVDVALSRRQRAVRQLLRVDLKVAAVVAGKRSGAVLSDGVIAKAAKVSAVTVQRARHRLRAAGLLTWTRSQHGNVYRLTPVT